MLNCTNIFLRVLGIFLRTYNKEHPSDVEETGILTNPSNKFIMLTELSFFQSILMREIIHALTYVYFI